MRTARASRAARGPEAPAKTYRTSRAHLRIVEPQELSFDVVVERDPDTGLFVGDVPGGPVRTARRTLDELQANLQEVVSMLIEDGEPKFESEFVAVQTIKVA